MLVDAGSRARPTTSVSGVRSAASCQIDTPRLSDSGRLLAASAGLGPSALSARAGIRGLAASEKAMFT